MNLFGINCTELFNSIGSAKKMVLATSKNNKVTARMMSCVCIDNSFYMQADSKSEKYSQIYSNPSVALCMDNIQIEGIAHNIGHPLDEKNKFFAEAYETHYKSSFDRYSAFPDEILIKVVPTKITLWIYEDNKPFREIFDFENKEYRKELYSG